MKKCIALFVVLLLSAAVMVSSCKKEDADEVDPGPGIHLKEGAGYIRPNDTVEINTEITVGFIGLKSPVSGQKLSRYRFSVIIDHNLYNYDGSALDSDSFEWETTKIPTSSVGQIVLIFELWDTNDMKSELSLSVFIEDTGPVIQLKQDTGYTSENGEIYMNTSITVGVVGLKSPVSGQKLSHFKFSILKDSVSTIHTDTIFSSDSFDWDNTFTFASDGEARLLFELWDKDGKRNEKSLYLFVKRPGIIFTWYSNVEFGSWNDVTGSFFSTTDGVVYNINQTSASPSHQAKVDFLYFYDTLNNNTFAAPDDVYANGIDELKLNLWTVKNPTHFNRTNYTADQFNGTGIGEILMNMTFDTEAQTTMVNNLKVNDIFMFNTKNDKLGLVMITHLSTPSRGDKSTASMFILK